MPKTFPNQDEFQIVERALQKDEVAIEALKNDYGRNVVSFLKGVGADFDEALDIVESMWAEGLEATQGKSPKLLRYSGRGSLQGWLKTVALNMLIGRRRRDEKRQAREREFVALGATILDGGGEIESTETPLVKLIHDAVLTGFDACSAEEYVLLQFYYRDALSWEELSLMWGRHPTSIRRLVKRAQEKVRRGALLHVESIDPWLEIRWADFVELSAAASPALFE